ncbi:2-oxoglutarate dehydrogenase complex dihydrolipoyllysine-residue succinyltransferase [Raineya orbicola]|jgi:2-oxoglutarate dehydrogenase E2 component (dihydrolipoamide succinyltransferase)|uniref:Dihydrolipoyllysine-residue succinyltransferase component of 2-oxoglutarate dehydrogenase complex n=1 Tax=Raineya orbicola TaxID=2016530 RepID=A0A2N3IHP9_9BACT|nr:2-oxoglutarate dehydrogenase complex dihydrolipoyllysine-residue succinyltransferase [Raineya orbicola]PKQ69837.1 sucB: dihydrolipoyllysine-residue succinyltransferase [Raineya orbicola]
MAIIEQKVPALGESITEVTVGSWSKKTGDRVELDEVIGVLESDKASFDITAEKAGILEIVATEGTTLPIGAVLCKIQTEAAQISTHTSINNDTNKSTPSASSNTNKGDVIIMKVKPLGESITEVTLGNWLKKEGDFVKMDEVLAEIESDKATFELTAEATGILHITAQSGATLKIGDEICKIEVTEAVSMSDTTTLKASETTTSSSSEKVDSYAKGHPSISASKILAEKGIDPTDVKGTGVGGRITKEDALKAEKKETKPMAEVKVEKEKTEVSTISEVKGLREQKEEKMTSLRKTIAKRLVAVKNETAMLTTFNEANMKPIMDLRAKYKDKFKEKHGIGLGFMSFFAKACATALLEFPVINAQVNGDYIVYHNFVDISVAVSTDKGLVVPVLRNVEQMSLADIEREIARLAAKAREGKLTIPEMTGGTFTITNGGVFGSMMSTPIINAPQSAILGMHNIVERPMAVNGEVKILPMMYLALSYDHRIIDGRDSVSFLVRVKQLLEEPERMLLQV